MRHLSRIETTIIRAAIERPRTFQQQVRPDRMREGHEGDLQLLGASMYGGTQFLSQLARYDGRHSLFSDHWIRVVDPTGE